MIGHTNVVLSLAGVRLSIFHRQAARHHLTAWRFKPPWSQASLHAAIFISLFLFTAPVLGGLCNISTNMRALEKERNAARGEVNGLSRNNSWKTIAFIFFFSPSGDLAFWPLSVTWPQLSTRAARGSYNRSIVTGEPQSGTAAPGKRTTNHVLDEGSLTRSRTSRLSVLTWKSAIGQFPS